MPRHSKWTEVEEQFEFVAHIVDQLNATHNIALKLWLFRFVRYVQSGHMPIDFEKVS